MFSAVLRSVLGRPMAVSRFGQSGYKSSISLDKLFPKSNLDHLAKPGLSFADQADQKSFSGYIPIGTTC